MTASSTTPTMTQSEKVIDANALERSVPPTANAQPATTPSVQPAITTAKPIQASGTQKPAQSDPVTKQAVRIPLSAGPSPVESPAVLNANSPTSKHASVVSEQARERALEVEEKELQETIKTLWVLNDRTSARLKGDRECLKTTKANLQRALFEYKDRLVGRGREGQWAPFIHKIEMSLSTADRYVKQWREGINPTNKLVDDQLSLTTEHIEQLALKVSKGLVKSLKTPSSISTFLEALQGQLRASATIVHSSTA